MKRNSRARSRPRPQIEPIHVPELLNGAGMRGFLSVLDPPPKPVRWEQEKPDGAETVPAVHEIRAPLPAPQSEGVFAQLKYQDRLLQTIAETVGRIHGGVAMLQLRAAALRMRRPAAPNRREGNHTFMKRAARTHRIVTVTNWDQWISESAPLPAEAVPAPNGHHPSHESIARLAHALWQQRGCPDDSAQQDWLEAERQLLQKA